MFTGASLLAYTSTICGLQLKGISVSAPEINFDFAFMNYNERIHLALHHEVENVAALAYSSSTKLEEQLQRVRNQIEIAARNKQTDALQLLQIWEGQITDARMLKAELQPGELEIADLNMTLPEIEAYEMIEQRSELLRQKLLKQTLTGAERK